MKLRRRHFLRLAAGMAVLATGLGSAWAQNYPTHSVRIMVGFTAGGVADIETRLIAQWLSERLGQPGASGNIATEAVVNAVPDGYTLLSVLPPNAVNATLYDKLNFKFNRDIVPVAGIMRAPNVMSVNPSFPTRTIREFIASCLARKSATSDSTA
jgi:tripartite-type tricarboxylate transporter receptor subunit TctC